MIEYAENQPICRKSSNLPEIVQSAGDPPVG
jgi:hypothetical protein